MSQTRWYKKIRTTSISRKIVHVQHKIVFKSMRLQDKFTVVFFLLWVSFCADYSISHPHVGLLCLPLLHIFTYLNISPPFTSLIRCRLIRYFVLVCFHSINSFVTSMIFLFNYKPHSFLVNLFLKYSNLVQNISRTHDTGYRLDVLYLI